MNPGEIESDFVASLRDAKLWSSRKLHGSTDFSCLRSSELAASHTGIDDCYSQSMAAINALVEARSRLLETHDESDWPIGRLLCCDVSVSEASGASELASDGYFNEFDLPPWDTWVAWVKQDNPAHKDNGFLLAFVPPQFNKLVQLGIDANPVDCVFWLDSPALHTMDHLPFVMPPWLAHYVEGNAT